MQSSPQPGDRNQGKEVQDQGDLCKSQTQSFSCCTLRKKTLFKELLTQDMALLCVASLGACSPVMASPCPALIGWGSQGFYDPTLGSEDQQKDTVRGLGGMRGRMSTAQLSKPSSGKSTHEVKKCAEL